MRLINQYDPDEWMAAGNQLLDYPYPPDGESHELMLSVIEFGQNFMPICSAGSR